MPGTAPTEPLGIAHAMADAAAAAWKEVAGRLDRHDKLGMGAGGNFTSRADDELERAILAVASRLGVSVLSEEVGLVAVPGATWLAVVDPLDGSRNAGRGIPFHCVSVAVAPVQDARLGAVVAGVVANLVTGDRYAATRGSGATLNGTAVGRRAFDRGEVMLGIIADYSDSEIQEAHARPDHHIRDLGSAALELCLAGTGALDAFIVRKPWLRVIDIAAGTLFVRECGGVVQDPASGRDLDMPLTMAVRSGILAAASLEALHAVTGPRLRPHRNGSAGPASGTGGLGDARVPGGPGPEREAGAEGRPRGRLGDLGAADGPLTWGIVGKAGIPHVQRAALWLRDHLRERGQTALLERDLALAAGEAPRSLADLDAIVDLFMTVGGDGTILMTLAATDKPIFGVNAGAIGFLAEVEPPQAAAAIDQVIRGDYRVEERDRLAAWLGGTRLPDATNEVTFQTSRIAKLIRFRVEVSGEVLDTLRGDGIIVGTATGSTGYAMSVGGPLMHPSVHGTVLAPIAPFRLSARPWVVPSDAVIEIHLEERDSQTGDVQARVVVDGQQGFDVPPGQVVRIMPSPSKARFVRLGTGFYERVRSKLSR